eukprot:g23133.t1
MILHRVSVEEKEKTFTFTVQKSGHGDLLGMDVKHKKNQYLVVSKIFDDGAIKRANGMVPEDQRLQERLGQHVGCRASFRFTRDNI